MASKQFRFGGLDNRHDPQEIGEIGSVVAVNVDHRNDGSIRRRQGYTATTLTGAALHSLWGSEDGTCGFVADGTQLNYLDQSLVVTPVLTLPTASGVKYVDAGWVIVAITTSGTRFMIGSAQYTPVAPEILDEETQVALPMSSITGTAGAYYNGRLYIANGESLYYSLPYHIGFYDSREYLIPMGGAIASIFAVDDGLWVSGSFGSVFLGGGEADKLVYTKRSSATAYSGAKVQPKDWNAQAVGAAYAVATNQGTMLFLNGGQILDVGKSMYYPPIGSGHSSIERDENGYKQLLTCFTYSGMGDTFIGKSIDVDHLDI